MRVHEFVDLAVILANRLPWGVGWRDRLMDFRTLALVFWSVFIAEMGDKTQLATVVFSSEGRNPLIVFLGSALALVLTSAIGVVAGAWLSSRIDPSYMKIAAGLGFIGIGLWTLLSR